MLSSFPGLAPWRARTEGGSMPSYKPWIALGALVIGCTVASLSAGCGGSVVAPRAPDGGPIEILLVLDLALEGKDVDR